MNRLFNKQRESYSMKHLKILYLEDTPTDVELVKRELTKSKIDFEMQAVKSKEEYINSLNEFLPDVVLSDHSLPNLNSLEALKLSKTNNHYTPVILITSTIPEEYAIEIMKAGASDYILKDRLQRLPSAILNAVETKQLEIEKQKYLDEVIESEALMKEIEYLANIGSWETNLIKGTSKWSDEIYNILGVKPAELQPSFENYFNFLHSDDRIYVEKTIKNAIQNLNALELNYRITDKYNNEKHVWSEFIIERDEENKPVLVTGFIQDVSERKLSEQTLKDSESRFREFFENAPEAILIADAGNNVVIDFNKNALSLFKINRADLLEAKLSELSFDFRSFDNYDEIKTWDQISSIFEDADSSFECKCRDGSGDEIYCDVRFTLLPGSTNKLIRASFVDITKRKKIEFERDMMTSNLINRNKHLEEITNVVNNNLQTPASNIKKICTELKKLNLNSDSQNLLQELISSVNGLDDEIHNLNNLIKFDS